MKNSNQQMQNGVKLKEKNLPNILTVVPALQYWNWSYEKRTWR